ncbi:MAG: cad [Thermomicrobiales bacterium]|nr:cad [Thermomicrobiales bacterium]
MVATLVHQGIPSCPPEASLTPDHRQAPMIEALRAYQCASTVSFATPGHKHGAGFDPEVRALLGPDLGAADVWLNTADHDAALSAAETLAAAAWGADRTFFLTNGSSGGNHAFLLAALAPGDEVIVGRDLHQSLLTALTLTGARPVYVAPRLHPELGVGIGIDPAELETALAAHPAAKLVAVVSPTYWGVACDVAALVDVAHRHGVPLYVDGAWGPHFGFHPAFPASPLAGGADAAVTSPHKLLTGLSQAAMLHVQGERVDAARVASTVVMTRTTSPLLPILVSLDACRRQIALGGEVMLERAVTLAETARRRLRAIPGVDLVAADRLGLPPHRVDPTRLVIDVAGLGYTGIAAERVLRDHHAIAPEMSDLLGLVCLVTPGDSRDTIDRLIAAVAALAGERRPALSAPASLRSAAAAIAPGAQALTPREAFFAPTRLVTLPEAVGAVAAEPVTPYPPGIPVLTPGEIVSAEKVDYLCAALAAGIQLRGPADPALRTIRVVGGRW